MRGSRRRTNQARTRIMHPALKSVAAPVNRDGWPFVMITLVLAVAAGLAWPPLFWPVAGVAAWVAYFFRDPKRVTPTRPGLVVSPGDGLVSLIATVPPPPELSMGDEPRVRISIFLSIFDVHIQRVPVDGVVGALSYRHGKFVNAALDKASEDNERMSVRVDTADGRSIAFVQIAGLVARRIRCDLADGQAVRAGERYGLIRFGSRVDVYLPPGVAPLVAVGQYAIGGETVFADLNSSEPAREGEER
ncbi:MAG: phosphatidylserine decarboxylase [Alphaproteobacteria bacterium]|nr:phosphatidylserine decarboxylase [Alphaproteobacteria bacterium]